MTAKYRAKRIDNNEWVYGVPVECDGRCWIVNSPRLSYFDEGGNFVKELAVCVSSIEVDPETVGQFTGVTGVYEGDIVEGESCGRHEPVFYYRGVIEYYTQADVVGWHVVDEDGGAWELKQICARISMEHISGCVIGNIHDGKSYDS